MLADLLSVATMMVIADSDLGVLSLAPFAVFSPIVHGAHGRGDAAFASLALHTGAPVVLGGLLYTLETAAGCNDAFLCGFTGLAVGFMGGMVTATIIDAAVLARPSREVRSNRWSRSVTPQLAALPRGGFVVGLGGAL